MKIPIAHGRLWQGGRLKTAPLAVLVSLLVAGGGFIAWQSQGGTRDLCETQDRNIYCSPACHPEDVYARRKLLSMDKIPKSLKKCADLAAKAITETARAGVEACISEVSSTDPEVARMIADVAKDIPPPSTNQVRSWEQSCGQEKPEPLPPIPQCSPGQQAHRSTKLRASFCYPRTGWELDDAADADVFIRKSDQHEVHAQLHISKIPATHMSKRKAYIDKVTAVWKTIDPNLQSSESTVNEQPAYRFTLDIPNPDQRVRAVDAVSVFINADSYLEIFLVSLKDTPSDIHTQLAGIRDSVRF